MALAQHSVLDKQCAIAERATRPPLGLNVEPYGSRRWTAGPRRVDSASLTFGEHWRFLPDLPKFYFIIFILESIGKRIQLSSLRKPLMPTLMVRHRKIISELIQCLSTRSKFCNRLYCSAAQSVFPEWLRFRLHSHEAWQQRRMRWRLL